MRERALAVGISKTIVDEALENLVMDEAVIALDQKQPERNITLAKYLQNTISARRTVKGQGMLRDYRSALKRISHTYHVPSKYLVALWGIESDYGAQQGNFSVLQSLATLAYEGRRRDFFADEFLAALTILSQEKMKPDALTGSWAGAMGHCQFMPSTYLRYAVDGDGDGVRDIWHSQLDGLASIASYLHALGWDPQLPWGVKATFPEDFDASEANFETPLTVAQWRKKGIHFKGKLPEKALVYAAYVGAPEQGNTYLVTENYKAILQWNRSRYFATAVGTLADIIGEP